MVTGSFTRQFAHRADAYGSGGGIPSSTAIFRFQNLHQIIGKAFRDRVSQGQPQRGAVLAMALHRKTRISRLPTAMYPVIPCRSLALLGFMATIWPSLT